jgi:hypothetical protein
VNTVQLTPTQHSHVVALDGEVRIVDFIETDPYVHRVLSESADPEEATHTILRVGAQATLIAGADLDAQVVERRFEGLARDFDSSLGTAVSRMSQVSSELLDGDNGALTRLLNQTRVGLKTMLDDTFDADSKSSAIAKIDAAFDGAVQQLDHKVRAALDPDTPSSALGKAKREILEKVNEVARDQDRQLRELATAVAVGKARAQATELTAMKGFTYEETLQRGLAAIASVREDTAEAIGRTTGLSGTQNGDLQVTINPEDTGGRKVRFVLECKDRRLSMPKTREELGKAIDNRAARAAIAVFSRADYAPNPLPFSWSGNQAVLVYDKDEPDGNALKLAYAWARWVSCRDLTADRTAMDVGRIEAALTRARQALARQQSARSCFTMATKKINEGTGHLGALVDEVHAALEELAEELNNKG